MKNKEGFSKRQYYDLGGPGGLKCVCCGPSPKRRPAARRIEKRRRKQAEKKFIKKELNDA